jgi:hypothetical protein
MAQTARAQRRLGTPNPQFSCHLLIGNAHLRNSPLNHRTLRMRQLSPQGQQTLDGIAQRHGFSFDATLSMLESVINGNGSMAQFNHPEFSGSGQWMRGGMTMVSDMFNNHLKGRVDSLCSELANLIADQPDLLRSGGFQSQSQGGSGYHQVQANHSGGGMQSQGDNGYGAHSLFVPPAPGTSGDWWPADLRWPNSTGAQNHVRYAHFAQARRLVIEVNGSVTVYDTLDHQIGGFSQQQSVGGTLSFSSQYGLIDVASLPVVSRDGMAVQAPPPAPAQNTFQNSPADRGGTDIFASIERLADLHAKGLLTDQEFGSKKAELLARL